MDNTKKYDKLRYLNLNNKQYVHRPPTKSLKSRCTTKTLRYGGGNIIAMVYYHYKNLLLIWIISLQKNNKRESVTNDKLPFTWIFMYDNAPQHNSIYYFYQYSIIFSMNFVQNNYRTKNKIKFIIFSKNKKYYNIIKLLILILTITIILKLTEKFK